MVLAPKRRERDAGEVVFPVVEQKTAVELSTDTELDALGSAGELEISSRRGDGMLSPPMTIWAVRHGDDIYVRSATQRITAPLARDTTIRLTPADPD